MRVIATAFGMKKMVHKTALNFWRAKLMHCRFEAEFSNDVSIPAAQILRIG